MSTFYVTDYATVAASQTDQALGSAGGKTGDRLERLIIIPATSAAGVVSIKDGNTSISIFAGGGTTALSDLKPLVVWIGARSVSGAWKVTTGANVSVIAVGAFS